MTQKKPSPRSASDVADALRCFNGSRADASGRILIQPFFIRKLKHRGSRARFFSKTRADALRARKVAQALRCVFHAVAPTSSFRRVTRAKRQKFIAVIFVLFLARRDLGGETDGEVAAERVELVEDRDDAILDVEGRERNEFIL